MFVCMIVYAVIMDNWCSVCSLSFMYLSLLFRQCFYVIAKKWYNGLTWMNGDDKTAVYSEFKISMNCL